MELEALLSRLLDASLGEAGLVRLNELLRSSESLTTQYMRWMNLHTDLLERSLQVEAALPVTGAACSPQRSMRGWASLATAMVLLLVVGLGVCWWHDLSRPAVAEVVGHSGAEVQRRFCGLYARSSRSLPPGAYRVRTGLIQLQFVNGVAASMQAPAAFELTDATSIVLHSGKLSVRVPNGAEGFAVVTDKGKVVDHGTEFAVSAAPARDEVHVFSGRVEVNPATEAVESMRGPLTLTTGEAAMLDVTTCTPAMIRANRDEFVDAEALSLGLRDSSSHPYAQRIAGLKPTLWLRMEPSNGPPRILDYSGFRHHGDLYGSLSSPFWSAGACETALMLGGPGSLQYGVIPDYHKPPPGQITGMVLVYAKSRPRWASIAKNWAGGEIQGQFHLGLHYDRGDVEIQVQDKDGRLIRAAEHVPLSLNTWHHVVFTHDGEALRLYRNGQQVAQAHCEGQTVGDLPALCIGAKLSASCRELEQKSWGLWHGRLDEFVLLDRVLSADEINSLAEIALKQTSQAASVEQVPQR